jgi:hypothetical protein
MRTERRVKAESKSNLTVALALVEKYEFSLSLKSVCCLASSFYPLVPLISLYHSNKSSNDTL